MKVEIIMINFDMNWVYQMIFLSKYIEILLEQISRV